MKNKKQKSVLVNKIISFRILIVALMIAILGFLADLNEREKDVLLNIKEILLITGVIFLFLLLLIQGIKIIKTYVFDEV